jgi:hypothetical protein
MSLNMLVETKERNYTAAEYSDWLTEVASSIPKPCLSRRPAPTAW